MDGLRRFKEEYRCWARDEMPDKFKQASLDDVATIREVWEESKKFQNPEKQLLELSVWDMDGNRVKHREAGDQPSSNT